MLRSFLASTIIVIKIDCRQLALNQFGKIHSKAMSSSTTTAEPVIAGAQASDHENAKMELETATATPENANNNGAKKEVKYQLIKEGKVEIYQAESVFYNPVQEFNRDMSIHVIDTYLKHGYWRRKKRDLIEEGGCKILEAFSASGLRSVRYAKEIRSQEMIKEIIANDLSLQAVNTIKKNIAHNQIESKVTANHDDAT